MRVRKSGLWSTIALIIVVIGLPLAILTYQARRKGLSLPQFIKQSFQRMTVGKQETRQAGTSLSFEDKKAEFLKKVPIGDTNQDKPWISHLKIADLDQDGLKDVVICDAKLNEIHWIRQSPQGVFTEKPIGTIIMAPAHVTECDLDKDGDLDLLVASMGMIFPNNDKIGSVVVLENDGNQNFTNRVLVKDMARVTDVEPGDFNGDGLIDLAVGQFGYDDGEIRWMKNLGNWKFESHILLSLSGTIHTPVVDIDRDGDLDFVALVSQEWEEIYMFENDGQGNFKTHMIWGSPNEDYGSSGIAMADLDQDGDLDILYTNGDAFDYIPPAPRPWHGIQWLENKGGFKFVFHRIADFPGAYSPESADLDKDGDLDLIAVSCFSIWSSPTAYSFAWYENVGNMTFVPHNITNNPTHQLVVQAVDMDNDGWTDLVTGGFYAYPPYDRQSRVLVWMNTLGKKQERE